MWPDATTRARRRRSTRLGAAVATGGVAKGLAVAVQLLAVGIAVRVLGVDAFGAYLVMASLVAWLGLAAVGVGPGLTQRIAVATANDDAAGQATALSSSVALSGLFVILAMFVVFSIAQVAVGGEAGVTAVSADIRTAALVLGLTTAAQVWLSVVEAAQLGHQEQYFANVFQAVGLAFVLAILLVAGPALTTVTAFVAATTFPPLVAKIGNAALYLARRRYLVTRHISAHEAVGVLSTSVAFAAVQLGSTASQQIGFLWLAFVAGPAATVPLGVMFRLNTAASGLVSLVTQPLWPALADAMARHRLDLGAPCLSPSVHAHRLLCRGVRSRLGSRGRLPCGGVDGANVEVPQLMLVLFGLYFVVGVWAHVNAITLVGLGKVWVAAKVTCLEAVVSSVGALLMVAQFGATGVILSLLIASATVSATLLPLAVRRSWALAAADPEPLAASGGNAVAQ